MMFPLQMQPATPKVKFNFDVPKELSMTKDLPAQSLADPSYNLVNGFYLVGPDGDGVHPFVAAGNAAAAAVEVMNLWVDHA